jgi:curved DNA-binding protein CbpA
MRFYALKIACHSADYPGAIMFVDYYEILQISSNADAETIRRIYHVQAQRFHPDNLDTGNADTFRRISEAYEVLGDAERRASYDREHREARRETNGIQDPLPEPPVMDEMVRREEILMLLYRRKFTYSEQPSLSLRELEVLLNTPKGHLEFSLWYLKETGYLVRTDNARHTITIKGVQFAEALKAGRAKWVEGV